jgi:hypothetical protein
MLICSAVVYVNAHCVVYKLHTFKFFPIGTNKHSESNKHERLQIKLWMTYFFALLETMCENRLT